MADRRETSAGGVVFRRIAGRAEVVVARQRDRLTGAPTQRLPKGKLEPGETPEETAVREVAEETGLRARVVEALGTADYHYCEGRERVAKRVHFYLMEWISGAPEPRDGEMESAFWCPLARAARGLSFEHERNALLRAERLLANGGAEP